MHSEEYSGVNTAGAALSNNGLETDNFGFDAGLEFQVERNFTINMTFQHNDKEANQNGAPNTGEEFTRTTAVLFGAEIGL